MNKVENFTVLIEKAMKIKGRTFMRPVIAKELLHYDILFCLDAHGLLDNLTFQGGTALRLCYGSQRLSEDLDFVGGQNFATSNLDQMKTCLEKYIGKRYGLEILVKEPKDMKDVMQQQNLKVDKWQISLTTELAKKDVPKQKIKIEVVNIPAYSRVPQALKQNYDFLPDGYDDMLIMTETLDEIMADKLISFVSCQRYVRYRDIWDLRWLKQQGAVIQKEFIYAKINDYKIADYSQKLELRLLSLDSIVRSNEFKNEMQRFLPISTLENTLYKPKFMEFLVQENRLLLEKVKELLG